MAKVIVTCMIAGPYTFNRFTLTLNQSVQIEKQEVEDDEQLREEIAVGVAKGHLRATYNGVVLSADDVRNIDSSTEAIDDKTCLARGHADVVNAAFYDVVFPTPLTVSYFPGNNVESNINTWVTNVVAAGFRINFSIGNYTGRVYWLAS